MDGYFKVHRKILDSQVFAHQTALKIWIWCLSKVTYKERYVPLKSGKGTITVKLNPGQFLFGRFKAEEELNIDGSTIYKWIQKFASDEFDMISIESNNQYSIITICKWEEYQNTDTDEVTTEEQPSNSEVTTEEQPSNSEVTAKEQPSNTNNKDNKDKNDKKEYFDFSDSLIALGIEKNIVTDWLKVRRTKKAANTETAFKSIEREIRLSGASANDCIKMAVENSWQGFNAEWYKNKKQVQKPAPTPLYPLITEDTK